MFPSLLVVSLVLAIPIVAAVVDAPLPPLHQSHFIKPSIRRRNAAATPSEEYIEVTRPLPFDSLTPACAITVLSHAFANTINLPPTTTNYSAPKNCNWSRAVIHLSGSSNGSQYDRIAAVWLSGVEVLRTSTPEPTPEGIFWNVQKEVTRYASLLHQYNLTLAFMLENVINDIYTGVFQIKLTFLYYDFAIDPVSFPLSLLPPDPNMALRGRSGLRLLNGSLDLEENPADLIIPVSAIGDEGGFWFKIEKGLDAIYQGIRIPMNTYRVVIELYVSFHGDDEFWYSNPPDAYIKVNGLSTKRGHGAFREVVVKIDDDIVGSVIPFPVIFTGGINPLFWEPVVPIGAFSLPSYEIDLTPFLGILLDGEEHFLGLGVTDAISFWLVDANLHLWLDHRVDDVQAGAIRYRHPNSCVQRTSDFQLLDGQFEIQARRDSEFSGWVFSSAGNFTVYVSTRLKFYNTLNFNNNGTEKSVKQETKVKTNVRIEHCTGGPATNVLMEKKYPLKMTTSNFPGSRKDSYLVITKLEHSLNEENRVGKMRNSLVNTQKSNGWMFVLDHNVLSGAADTIQNYETKDKLGCYSRHILVSRGSIENDTERFVCASASAYIW